ncbi:putative oxidoreductase ENV9 [Candida viswanathii]|uniref:Putative oxidoreductase ENV9 n=1 Tax=Candida viswanathii TaxID=5486 RepID=A0A367XU53_9ASCO|nr:putative oxidoreductase ENV9 [Candida viswanathii]
MPFVDKSKFYNPATAPAVIPKDQRKVVFLTGGNSGIGWFTALHLYQHGYVVYLAGRTESKVLKAIDDIKAEAVKRGTSTPGELSYIHLDLTDLSTVGKAVEEFSQKEKSLDILINNAGLMGVPFEVTKDDYEIQYQVNFVGHFLLTLKLIPFLENAARGGVTPRIVNLASVGHNFEVTHISPANNKLNKFPDSVFTWVRYGLAKTAQIQFAKELAIKYPNILSLSVHPGVVIGTELYNYWKNLPVIGYAATGLFAVADKTIGVTVEEGSLASLRAALDPTLTLNENGDYLTTGGSVDKPSGIASNPEYAEETWNWNVEQLKKRDLL